MTPEEIKDLEARAEEYSLKTTVDDNIFYDASEIHHLRCYARQDYIAGSREQHEITRKATIDEVLGLLREGVDPVGTGAASGWADWLEQKMRGDGK